MKPLNLSWPKGKLVAAVIAVACLGVGSWSVADNTKQPNQPGRTNSPPARQQQEGNQPDQAQAIKLDGTIAYYNLGPQGEVESINLTPAMGWCS